MVEGAAEMMGVNTVCVSCSTDFKFLLNIFVVVVTNIYYLNSALHKSLCMLQNREENNLLYVHKFL